MPKPKLAPMPRLPKEPSPHMVRSFGRPSLDTLAPPDPSAPPVASPSPSAYRREHPDDPPPAEYKPPSMLAEHKGLAILFALLCIAFALYCWKAPRAPSILTAVPDHPAAAPAPPAAARPQQADQHASADEAQPVYIETVPPSPSR
jgi:hypothetical protein